MAQPIPVALRVSLDAAEAESVIVRFLKDYLSDAGRSCFIVGISGGLDSAVAAALAVRAVGKANVHGYILPEKTTPQSEVRDAQAVVSWLGIGHSTFELDRLVREFHDTNRIDNRAIVGNTKARIRMILLHAEAAKRGGLVLGTGNKSESLTGYFSKHGDGGVDVQPIGDLYKTQVRLLAKHLGVPPRIITKPPTAGLWDRQTDEEELGISYDVLDRILLGLELKFPPARIAEIVGVPEKEVERIESMRRTSQHKRRMPMAPKIGLRTVGLDWRTPTAER
ncbi:MAG: NAD+ synthase [Euryarchaeota archaeon]|nr:NAD+ synthase [Euryarchaeota archaeon]